MKVLHFLRVIGKTHTDCTSVPSRLRVAGFDPREALVDEITRRAGVAPRQRVATAALEAGYRFSGGMLVYARGTLFDSHLSSEVPFLYNAATAQRMSRIYGYLTLGLILPF